MFWQVTIKNLRTGGIMVCGVSGRNEREAFRTLAYLPGAGGNLVIDSIRRITPRDKR